MGVLSVQLRPLLLVLALLLSPLGPVACASQGPSANLGCGSGGMARAGARPEPGRR
jgi:hypothetical protein